ncbi:hypothetical protein M378DRAFT_170299 [Amanita muscaria Koide BX008]|uniref:Uncharacterized protein n=1 Tax=Amanita muscaria (strain Koide BX008) TaxID=946122 RepID=A0A0C2S7B7_AMAMK|nr:hypothetical protein M378DRAFT_170299 [Amanita muscaria Koide BX008]
MSRLVDRSGELVWARGESLFGRPDSPGKQYQTLTTVQCLPNIPIYPVWNHFCAFHGNNSPPSSGRLQDCSIYERYMSAESACNEALGTHGT